MVVRLLQLAAGGAEGVSVEVAGLHLILDSGTTDLEESDGILGVGVGKQFKYLHPSSQHVLLPSGQASSLMDVVELPEDKGVKLTMTTSNLEDRKSVV